MALACAAGLAAAALTSCSSDKPTPAAKGSPSSPTSRAPTPGSSSAVPSPVTLPPGVRPLPADCFEGHSCFFEKGSYGLGDGTVLPGLRLTLPAGWASHANDAGELNLIPAGARPDETVDLWLDPAAVRSTGPDHATLLPDVGRTTPALTAWLVANPDFQIVSRPRRVVLGQGLRATALTLAVSSSARYGDPDCPANPRCADLITIPEHWQGDFFGIGGDEEVRLYLATVGDGAHTAMLALDAPGHRQLLRLLQEARPVIDSLRWP